MAVYKVLDPLALRIGGKRVRADRTVELSDVEAEHELRVGSVEKDAPVAMTAFLKGVVVAGGKKAETEE
jgi:hypothetical protein